WQRVRLCSQQALQMVRILQRDHWEDAVRDLPSPVSSPFTIAFESLPAQARLAMQLNDRAAKSTPNLLPSGNFEDGHTLAAVGWDHDQDSLPTVGADAEVGPMAKQGKSGLRMTAFAATQQAAADLQSNREFVSVITPKISVHAGHAVRISGWIKL